jgi:DNA-directed RNA polymerase specialized sigma subunit
MYALAQKTGGVPTDAQMARALDLSATEYDELLEQIRPASYVCLDSIHNGDSESGASSHDIITDDS